MGTIYFLNFEVPEESKRLVGGPADSIPELAEAFWTGCRLIMEGSGLSAGDEVPPFHPFAEEDGQRRPFSDVEFAALLASFEQTRSGRFRFQFEPADDDGRGEE